MAIRVDRKMAVWVFDRLVDARIRRQYPYNLPKAIPPQVPENLPRLLTWGSREHALFLFALCYWMRGGIESDTATRALTRVYNMVPDMFLPEHEPSFDPATFETILSEVGLGFNKAQIARLWKKNLAKIGAEWDGDPRTLFTGISTYEEACERIQNKGGRGFGGFQEKMVSMLTYFYMDAGMVDRWNFPAPVDFHCLRIVFAHRILTAGRRDRNRNGFYTKPVLATVRALLHDYCAERGVDPVILCEALWIYSRIMCSEHPGNTSIVAKARKGRKTKITPIPRWTISQTQMYERTCRGCVVQDTCRHCIPSASYYVGGKVVLRGERDAPPQESLFPVFNPVSLISFAAR